MTDDYDAVVYDLDGTLVRLAVDWNAATADVAAVYDDAGVEVDAADVWELIERAEKHGLADAAEAALAEREVAGARECRCLDLAEEVRSTDTPVGVCSLNCEDAVRVALERHDLSEHVDAVVGRDSAPGQKPAPEPLLAAVEDLDATPERSLFVGDSASDREAAERAGVAFQWMRERVAEDR